ncbi:electron transfer flavoprotein subunit beta [Pseudomonas sp. MYb185]|uniref:electron transfer flavoprotein subunit beta/FixA family protein n=1 Tax=Pseudomonas sp. MYb185 TaxID=1848729 RepID=UPI000CFCC3D9|nr:electron transfer flavoprotein subunit beta [Pseudomonas sp. MYb185]PRB81394.1 electron transfer flavoprotein subunit beta [Pseudomonas sp. MYb185]
MNILVLLAGVADSRYPLHEVGLDNGQVRESGQSRRILSPFDEGALELALKLRDQHDDCRIEVLVLGGSNQDNLLRTVAAFKPDRLRCLQLQPYCPWDARLSSEQIGQLLRGEGQQPDLLLIGREFGDLDEGGLPVMLAARLGLPLFSLTQYAEWQNGQLSLLRERGTSQQWHRPQGALVATVTNDRRNKLRHPLMKNVMMAKKMSFDTVIAQAEPSAALALEQLLPAREVQRGGNCRMLDGDVNSQAAALLAYLQGGKQA